MGMISMLVAPAETTRPEYLPVKYKGVTQLKASSIFYIFNFLNNILAIIYKILRSVYTFSRIITVLPLQEQFMYEKKIL